MITTRHLPWAILLLLMAMAVAALIVGVQIAKEERVELIEQDVVPLTNLSSQLRRQVEGLEKNYERTLLEFCRSLQKENSDRGRDSLAETYTGIRQIVWVETSRVGRPASLTKSLNLGKPVAPPVLSAKIRGGIDLRKLEVPGTNYFWSKSKNGIWYFVHRPSSRKGTILICAINAKEVAGAMTGWLMENSKKVRDFPDLESWNYEFVSASKTQKTTPEIVYPIDSRLGSWQIRAWKKRQVITEYREPILITAAAISLGLMLVGGMLFYFLKRSFAIAEKRVSFVNQVSHELRTPLTNIMLNLDLTTDSIGENKVARRRLGLVSEELSRLRRLLENVLSFSQSKENNREFDLAELDLDSEVKLALEASEPILERHKIEIHRYLDAGSVVADRDALAQILGNLISNVVKYGGEGSEMILQSSNRGNSIVLHVIDSGPGVASRSREKIFRPFYRLNNRVNEGVSGSGLGLAIARDLATAMSGELRCLPRLDGETGSCFELILQSAEMNRAIVPFETKVS